MSARDMSKLGVGGVYVALMRVLTDELAVEHLGAEWGAVEVPHPGRQDRGDLYFAIVARNCIDAMAVAPRTPIRHMVDEAQKRGEVVTDNELRARLRRARDRRLLTAAPAGQSGGELTGFPKSAKTFPVYLSEATQGPCQDSDRDLLVYSL